MKLIVTRPEEDSLRLLSTLQEKGHEVVLAPMIMIEPRKDASVPDLPYQAVCLTSANAARHLPESFQRRISAFTVGAQSASAAFAAGFAHVEAKGDNVDGLAAHVIRCLKPERGPVLYVSGSETSGDLQGKLEQAGFSVTKIVAYDAKPLSLKLTAEVIAGCRGVLLYSRRTAKIWTEAVKGLEFMPRLYHFCLSAQVADAVPRQWRIRVARQPTEMSLLELIDLAGK